MKASLTLFVTLVSAVLAVAQGDLETRGHGSGHHRGHHHKNPKSHYSSVVVFGASYCDNAHPRDASFSGSIKPPPYYKGRYSNGPIFIEKLANGALGYKAKLFDYAYGGAQANNDLTYNAVPDTRNQSLTYISEVTKGKINRGNGAVLHVWWIGINPITQIWTDAIKQGAISGNETAVSHAQDRVQAQISEVLNQVKTVKANNKVQARPSNYIVLPIPPLEIVPTFLYQAKDLSGGDANLAATYLAYIGTLASQYNSGLTNGLGALGHTKGTHGWVRTYNVPAFWYDMRENPSKYKLTNDVDACLDSNNVPCSTPSTYGYWDTLHPTTQVHGYLAERLAVVATAKH